MSKIVVCVALAIVFAPLLNRGVSCLFFQRAYIIDDTFITPVQLAVKLTFRFFFIPQFGRKTFFAALHIGTSETGRHVLLWKLLFSGLVN